MARPKPSTFDKTKTVAENRRARFDYFIEDVFEAGIALSGTERRVKRHSSDRSTRCAKGRMKRFRPICSRVGMLRLAQERILAVGISGSI